MVGDSLKSTGQRCRNGNVVRPLGWTASELSDFAGLAQFDLVVGKRQRPIEALRFSLSVWIRAYLESLARHACSWNYIM